MVAGDCSDYAMLTIGTDEPQMTFRGFVEGGVGEHALIFAIPTLVTQMESKSEIHVDGTFKVVPKLAYQLLTVGYMSNDHFVPALHALMTKKTERLYVAVLEKLQAIAPNLSPNIFVMDFEATLIGAVSQVYPDTQAQGCFFHFAQAVLRKFRSLGLHSLFLRSPEARRFLRLNLSVAMLPAESIAEVIDVDLHPGAYLFDATPGELEALNNAHAYMVQQWKPKADVVSVFGCARRTNNSLESLHAVMLKRFGTHPNFWSFMNTMHDFMRNAVQNARRLDNGLHLGRLKKPRNFQHDAVIAEVSQQLKTKRVSSMEYLAVVSHRMASGIIDRELGISSEPVHQSSPDDQPSSQHQPSPEEADQDQLSSQLQPSPAQADQDQPSSPLQPLREEADQDQPSSQFRSSPDPVDQDQPSTGQAGQRARSRRRRRPSTPDDVAPKRRLRDLPVRRAAASITSANQSKSCPVCLQSQADVAIVPCGHCLCRECLDHVIDADAERGRVNSCPVCRTEISDKLKLHFV
jgi:hypothetical protein